MERYAYIQAHTVDNHLSFRHTIIEANTEEEAYTKGHEKLGAPLQFINDYIVPIPECENEYDALIYEGYTEFDN